MNKGYSMNNPIYQLPTQLLHRPNILHYPDNLFESVPLYLATITSRLMLADMLCRFWCGTSAALAALDSVNVIPRWMREKIVTGLTLVIMFLGHLTFLVCVSSHHQLLAHFTGVPRFPCHREWVGVLLRKEKHFALTC